jgi:TolB-like protein/DNA-binding SARP family transcriptional activator
LSAALSGDTLARVAFTAAYPEMPAEPSARVYCLGHFHIEWQDGVAPSEPVQLKPLALLKLLIALGARHVPQDRLVDSLWPDSDGDAAQTAFTSTLYRLRRLLGQHAVILRNRQLSLDPARVWWDVQEFEAALAQASNSASADSAQRLIALYRGPFLEGEFDPPEIIRARERLHGRFLRAIREAGEVLVQAGAHDAAIDLYRQTLEVDPLAEELGQQLMRALGETDRASQAAAVHQRLKRALAAQGSEVSARTDTIRKEVDRVGSLPAADSRPLRASDTAFDAAVTPHDTVHAAAAGEMAGHDGRRWTQARVAWIAASLAVAAVIAAGLGMSMGGPSGGASPVSASPPLMLPSEPSIVVLPFTSMSGDPEHGHFADGLTDTLITDLSRLHKILVIARNSSFAYKGRAVDVRKVGRELGVRHVLEGSVQSSEGRLRVNVQLTEAATGAHVWAERYDRPVEDMFLVQDDIASRVVEELDVVLVTGEQARQWRRMTKNPDAYAEVLAGRAIQGENHSIDGMMRSRAHFRRAIELDPDFALPYAYMVSVYQHLTDSGYDAEPDITYETALAYADRATQLNPGLPIARAYRGAILQQLRRYDESLHEYRLAVQYGPNAAESLMLSAWGMAAVGDATEALPIALRAMRLDPIRPGWYWGGLADTYLRLERWEEAIPAFERCLEESVDLIWCRAGLTVANVRAGRLQDARRAALEWRRIDPEVKAAENFYLIAWRDPTFRTMLAQALGEAGL